MTSFGWKRKAAVTKSDNLVAFQEAEQVTVRLIVLFAQFTSQVPVIIEILLRII
jgi:hypothetical protein